MLKHLEFLIYRERFARVHRAISDDNSEKLRKLFTSCKDSYDREALIIDAAIFIEDKRDKKPSCLQALRSMWVDPKIVTQHDKVFRQASELCLESLKKKRKTI